MGYTSSLMDIDWYLDRQSVYKGFRFSPLSNMCIKCGTVLWTAKFGVEPSECVQLAKHVKKECPNLQFSGLMTIGMLDYTSTPENFQVMLVPGFQNLGFEIDSWSSGDVGFMDQDARVEILEAYLCFFLSITEDTCV
jgi:hypothetical protein